MIELVDDTGAWCGRARRRENCVKARERWRSEKVQDFGFIVLGLGLSLRKRPGSRRQPHAGSGRSCGPGRCAPPQ